MTISPAILKHYPDSNDAQREVVSHLDGPLLVVACPVHRTLLDPEAGATQTAH